MNCWRKKAPTPNCTPPNFKTKEIKRRVLLGSNLSPDTKGWFTGGPSLMLALHSFLRLLTVVLGLIQVVVFPY